jgi:hypothetical protein
VDRDDGQCRAKRNQTDEAPETVLMGYEPTESHVDFLMSRALVTEALVPFYRAARGGEMKPKVLDEQESRSKQEGT